MASLNKTSVRDEVSRLKADFETLCSPQVCEELKAQGYIINLNVLND
jgi:hypothetical protein